MPHHEQTDEPQAEGDPELDARNRHVEENFGSRGERERPPGSRRDKPVFLGLLPNEQEIT
nr:hypothetical protein [Streptomyces sp. DSM 41633]